MEGRKEGRTKTRLRAIGSLGDGSSFTILVVLFVPEVPFVALIYSSLLFLFLFLYCPLELFIFVLARLVPRQSAALPTGS